MQAGSDYLLFQGNRHGKQNANPRWAVGVVLFSLGVLLVSLTSGYYFYASYARSQLPQLETTSSLDLPKSTTSKAKVSPITTYQLPSQSALPLYPADVLRAQDWNNPVWAEDSLIKTGVELLPQYQSVDWSSLPRSAELTPATQISIPAIGLTAEVEGLDVVDLGDYRAYETPSFTVGHIPETANPGSGSNGWYFGHLESPIKGEGSVFRNLPELADIVRTGEKVYITVENTKASYLYQVTRTRVVHQDDFAITELPEPTITLVTCIPRLVYDHRLLVEAKLVGVKHSDSA